MKQNIAHISLIVLTIFIFSSFHSSAILWTQEVDKIPISFERYSDRVLVVKSGDVYIDQVIALASKKGLVVVDTGKAPSLSIKYRKIIEREFGRNDFLYVINSHSHFDHTSGNQVFTDVQAIIAHEKCPELMFDFENSRMDFIASRKPLLSQWENQLAAAEPGSQQALYYQDIVSSNHVMLDDLEKRYVLTPPNMTFRDRLTLDLGDLTLKLYYFGEGRHTGDDILIHCPEEKLLFTGDLFYGGSMQIAYQPGFNGERWIEVMNEVLKDDAKVEYAYDTHNGRMTRDFLVLWRNFLVDLWEGLSTAFAEGSDFAAVENQFAYENKFAYLEQSGINPQQLRRDHRASLENVWMSISGVQPASRLFDRLITEMGAVKAAKELLGKRLEWQKKYLFNEMDFNTLGYRYLNQGQKKEAIEIFKFNVTAYPNSWNTQDSLAEAYIADGQKELAIKSYERSLELNPDNENAKMMLERLRK